MNYDLSNLNLSGMDFEGMDLDGSNFEGSKMHRTRLQGASLVGANLQGAQMLWADLRDSDLRDATLVYADLAGVDFRDSSLRSADLSRSALNFAGIIPAKFEGADLTHTLFTLVDFENVDIDLSGANLDPIRENFWSILEKVPDEVAGFRDALAKGRVNGTLYDGPCACLFGTIPGVEVHPTKQFFLAIREGEINQFSKIVLGWINQWERALGI